MMSTFHVSKTNIEWLVAPVSKKNYMAGKEEARRRIQYTGHKPLVVYTGKLGKGINELDYIIDAAEKLPQFQFILTGGKDEAVSYFKNICGKRKIGNISFSGFINDSTFISNYQLAADALVSYYTKQDHVVEYNFPQKLIEYMHTKNPIVTPDFPATRDLINVHNAILVEPDNPAALAEGIRKAVEDKQASAALASQAFKDVEQFSSENRAGRLVNFLNNLVQ